MIADPPTQSLSHPPTPSGPPADAAEAIRRLEDGNRHFARQLADADPSSGIIELTFEVGSLGSLRTGGWTPKQQPFAAVLGCADARVPTEMVLGQSANNLFVVRVAGNVLGSECLGSLDYAVANLGASIKLLVVLGHSNCGAVTAAVASFLDPSKYLTVASTQSLRAVVDRIFVPVRAAANALEHAHGIGVVTATGYRAALIEMTVAMNAAFTAATLRQEFAAQLGPDRDVVYGVYNLATGRVKLPLLDDADVAIRLAHPPADDAGFDQLGMLLATSGATQRLLSAGTKTKA